MLSPANGTTENNLTRPKAQYRGQAAGSCGSPRLQMRVPVLDPGRPRNRPNLAVPGCACQWPLTPNGTELARATWDLNSDHLIRPHGPWTLALSVRGPNSKATGNLPVTAAGAQCGGRPAEAGVHTPAGEDEGDSMFLPCPLQLQVPTFASLGCSSLAPGL